MRQDATDFAIQDADQLGAARHGDSEQLFRCQTKRVLLVHRRDIIEPVEIRDRLQIGLLLDQLFGAAMKQPDMRIETLHHLAVEFQHQTQHAVSRGVLRSEIDSEIPKSGLVHRTASASRLAANGR